MWCDDNTFRRPELCSELHWGAHTHSFSKSVCWLRRRHPCPFLRTPVSLSASPRTGMSEYQCKCRIISNSLMLCAIANAYVFHGRGINRSKPYYGLMVTVVAFESAESGFFLVCGKDANNVVGTVESVRWLTFYPQ